MIFPQPKGKTRQQLKGRKVREKRKDTASIRQYVFARERDICRCCRFRPAESMHELRFKSLGGKVSKRNSVAVCGDGVRGCHGFLQRWEISAEYDVLGAEDVLLFTIESKAAADWMRLTVGHTLASPPLRDIQFDVERDS